MIISWIRCGDRLVMPDGSAGWLGARPILAAGLGDALRDLVQQIAANAANPIADAIEEALTAGTDRVT